MIIEATDDEMKEMVVLAIKSSQPMGLGFLHYNPNLKIERNDIVFGAGGKLYIDYLKGRMVKLYVQKIEEGKWQVDDDLSSEYQSWIRDYPTWQDLLNAARSSINSEVEKK